MTPRTPQITLSAWGAWRSGLGRVARAPALVIGCWVTTVFAALPAALTLRAALAAHLGDSLAAAPAADGVNHDWWQEFLSQASGIGTTFVPSILGFAAPLRNISAFADAAPLATPIAATLAAYLVLLVFLTGGIVDRLARDRRLGAHAFFAACGSGLPRLLRLGVFAIAVYAVLLGPIHAWLFDGLYPALVRDLTVERQAFAVRAGCYAAWTAALAGLNLVFDFAKIRLIVEDRRSATGALSAGLRFVARHPRAALSVYLLNAAAFIAVLAVYAAVAPGALVSGWALAGAVLVMQLFIVARVAVRLTFVASETALFQSRLAHAGYVARPAAARAMPAAIEG
jgi:hypothetical protein